jgi:CheY-like chemotaxis protein
LVTRWLEREGHHVTHEVSGPSALEALAADPLPDLLLLDVMLPRIDGFAVLRRLRAEPRMQQLPVIILSSFDRHEDVARGLELGANDYIVKPPMEFHFLGRIARFAKKAP